MTITEFKALPGWDGKHLHYRNAEGAGVQFVEIAIPNSATLLLSRHPTLHCRVAGFSHLLYIVTDPENVEGLPLSGSFPWYGRHRGGDRVAEVTAAELTRALQPYSVPLPG